MLPTNNRQQQHDGAGEMTDRPHLPPRPSTASNQPPIATRKLVAPPRRPGAPVPGGTSVARSTVLSPAQPALAAATTPTSGAPSSFPLSTSSSTNILPPPVRRLPVVSASALNAHSPTLTPITLDSPQPYSTSPAASAAPPTESSLIPRLPPRKQPSSHPRSSFPPLGSSPQQHQSHIFHPTSTLPPATALNSSNATAALLPPPVRTNRTSPSGPRSGPASSATPANVVSSTTPTSASTLSGTPPRYLPPLSHQQTLQQQKSSSPTAAIILPAARARYEALFDRELSEQNAKRKLRRLGMAASSTATAGVGTADGALSRSLGASMNSDVGRASQGPPQYGPSSFKGAFSGRLPGGNGGHKPEGISSRPPGARHKFGTSDPSFNMSRGSSQSEHASNDSHSASPATTAAPANVSALKGFFEGRTSSGPTNDGSLATATGRPPLQQSVRPPERTMTKSHTDTTLLPTGGSDAGLGPRPTLHPQLSSYQYPSTSPTSGAATKSPFPRGSSPSDRLTPEGAYGSRHGNGNGSTRLRAVSASSAGPASPISEGPAGSRSPLEDEHLGVSQIQTAGGAAGNGKYPFQLRVRPAPPPGSPGGPIHTSNSLRSLSSKNLRADALAASSSRPSSSSGTANLIRFSGSSAISSSSSITTANTTSSADRLLSPKRIRKIWRRSHLRTRFLAKLWDVMGGNALGMEKEMFVRSMAAIDFELAKKSKSGGGGVKTQQRAGSSQQQQPPSSSAVGTGRGAGGAVAGVGPARGRAPDRVW